MTLFALALSCTALAAAHLMPDQQGTVHQVDRAVFSVLALPASALRSADDDGDGTLSVAELAAHADALRGVIAAGFRVASEDGPGTVERIDLLPSHAAGAPSDGASSVVALVHHTFARTPEHLDVELELFGAAPGARAMKLTARRGEVKETLVFTPERTKQRFFAPPPLTARLSAIPPTKVLTFGAGLIAMFVLLALRVRSERAPGSARAT